MASDPVSKNPFAGAIKSSVGPVSADTGLTKLSTVKLPANRGMATARLAAALAKLPSAPRSRGNASDLFLP